MAVSVGVLDGSTVRLGLSNGVTVDLGEGEGVTAPIEVGLTEATLPGVGDRVVPGRTVGVADVLGAFRQIPPRSLPEQHEYGLCIVYPFAIHAVLRVPLADCRGQLEPSDSETHPFVAFRGSQYKNTLPLPSAVSVDVIVQNPFGYCDVPDVQCSPSGRVTVGTGGVAEVGTVGIAVGVAGGVDVGYVVTAPVGTVALARSIPQATE